MKSVNRRRKRRTSQIIPSAVGSLRHFEGSTISETYQVTMMMDGLCLDAAKNVQ
jgi:hypothetical protein